MRARTTSSLTVLFVVSASAGFGQNVGAPLSPEVSLDNRVTFRLLSPYANEVLVGLEGTGRLALSRSSDGVWSVTTAPLEPDLYAYSFTVDGTPILDPSNPEIRPNLLNPQSVLRVRGPSPLVWEAKAVSRGRVHFHSYRSRVAGEDRDFYVYTPPGYAGDGRKRYPVLYLQHGYSGDARAWLFGGPANVILDNLIAEGRAEPMLLVMSVGYGIGNFVRPNGPDLSRLRENYEGFRSALLAEVIPQVEAEYRVDTNRNSRAIAGLSMGGAEALYVGLNAPDQFSWIGSFSAGGMLEYDVAFPELDAGVNRKLKLLWIACGTEDPLLGANRTFRDWLDVRGVHFTAVETSGMHTWMVWRRNLAAFVPLLFRPHR